METIDFNEVIRDPETISVVGVFIIVLFVFVSHEFIFRRKKCIFAM